MKALYNYLGEVLHNGPSDRWEQFTPWIVALLSALVLAVMTYAWWTAPVL